MITSTPVPAASLLTPGTRLTVGIPRWLQAERALPSGEWTGLVWRVSARAFLLVDAVPVVRLSDPCLGCRARRGDGCAWPGGYCLGCAAKLGLPAHVDRTQPLDVLHAEWRALVQKRWQSEIWLPNPPHTKLAAIVEVSP